MYLEFFNKHLSSKYRFLIDIICLICLHSGVSQMGLRFFENLLMSYNYILLQFVTGGPSFKISFLNNTIKYV